MTRGDLAIVGGDVVRADAGEGAAAPATVVVQDGRVAAILAPDAEVTAATVVDARGMLVIPGVIDIHVHCRDPSYTHRGDFASETRAAAAGGVTTIFEMPISKPGTSTHARWLHRRDIAAAKAHVNVGLYAAPGMLDGPDLARLVDAGAIAFKLFTTRAAPGREDEFEGLTTDDLAHVMRALELMRDLGLRCVFHAEEPSLLDLYRARAQADTSGSFRRHQASRPAVVETVAVAALVQLAQASGCPIHIAHVTSAAALELVRFAKRSGAPVTAETCPHYLFCTDDDLEHAGAFGVINPPLRTAADRDALWAGLLDGTLDVVATDHAPFSRAEKLAVTDLLDAPPGHPGLEHLVPLMMTAVADGRLPLARAIELMSSRPAELFGLAPAKGRIAVGADADLTVYDPRARRTLRNGEGESKAADCNALYDGMEVAGRVHATVVGGTVVYRDGQVTAPPGTGRIVRPNRPGPTGVSA